MDPELPNANANLGYDGNFYDLVARHARADPDALFLEDEDGQRLTRGWLDRTSARYANALLGLGCQTGDRVAVQVDKSPFALALFMACLRAGVAFLPINTAYRADEVGHLLSDAEPAVLVASTECAAVARDLPAVTHDLPILTLHADGTGELADRAAEVSDDFATLDCSGEHIGALIYTSGTTGRPKGAILPHRAISSCALTLGAEWRFGESDVLLHALPLFHGHGLFVSSAVALAAGAALLLHRKFEAEAVIDALPRATVFMGVPTFYHRLLASERLTPDRSKALRLFTCGSAPLSSEVHREFQRRTGQGILERYGATETMILCANPYRGERRAGSVGWALPGVELRITGADGQALPAGEVGMIEARGDGLFSGYWRQPERTREAFTDDGFFTTGDLAKVTQGGYIVITGRSKDLIISGGYNVYPAEVEFILDEHPSVREAAVVGTPHPDFGEAVVAFVIPSDPGRPPSDQDVIQEAKRKLANYKVPKKVVIVEDFPRNALGKVLKDQLRALATRA